MEFFKFLFPKKSINNEVRETIAKIRQGDNLIRESFIDNYKSFILETISQVLGKSSIPKNSPEFSIGIDAFNHCIDNFDLKSNTTFLSYSEQTIKEWILSFTREESTSQSLEYIDESKYYLYSNVETTDEISQFKRQLWEFGIKLKDLYYTSPSDKPAIEFCLKSARTLTRSNIAMDKLSKNKNISLEGLDDELRPNKKMVDKYKNYIIALALIQKSNLRILRSYIRNLEIGKDSNENIGLILEISNDEDLLFTNQCKFVVVKHTKGNTIGKQIQFGNYRVHKVQKSNKLMFIAWVATSIILCLAVYKGYSMITTSRHSDYNPSQANSSLTDKEYIPDSESEIIIPTPSLIPASGPEDTDEPSLSPSPTSDVSRVPGEVRISSDLYTVTIDQEYTIHMYMRNGNNGIVLVLYENDREYTRLSLNDNTPNPQAKRVTIKAEELGSFTYRWELINDYGSTSSKVVNVRVVDESVADSVYSQQ